MKATQKELKPLGNENSYTADFFEELCQKINLNDQNARDVLGRTIILAAQAYIRNYSHHLRELPSHEVKEELKKSLSHIDKAAHSLIKVYTSGYYSEAVINNLFDVIDKKYPSLHSLLDEIVPPNKCSVASPLASLPLLEAMADGIEQTLDNFESQNTPKRSKALYHWVMILSAKLEPIIGRKLEQSQYHKGEYISKKEISDSELLLFIIHPIDSNVTVSQIETAIKETRKERHDAPWDNYFPD